MSLSHIRRHGNTIWIFWIILERRDRVVCRAIYQVSLFFVIHFIRSLREWAIEWTMLEWSLMIPPTLRTWVEALLLVVDHVKRDPHEKVPKQMLIFCMWEGKNPKLIPNSPILRHRNMYFKSLYECLVLVNVISKHTSPGGKVPLNFKEEALTWYCVT